MNDQSPGEPTRIIVMWGDRPSGINPNKMPDDTVIDTLDRLCLLLGGSVDSFTGDLLRLMRKADPISRRKLHFAYPMHEWALHVWETNDPMTALAYTSAWGIYGLFEPDGANETAG